MALPCEHLSHGDLGIWPKEPPIRRYRFQVVPVDGIEEEAADPLDQGTAPISHATESGYMPSTAIFSQLLHIQSLPELPDGVEHVDLRLGQGNAAPGILRLG